MSDFLDVEPRFRPDAQREELGPVANYLACTFFDQAGAIWSPELLPNGMGRKFGEWDGFAHSLRNTVSTLLKEWRYEVDYSEANELLRLPVIASRDQKGKLAFAWDMNRLLTEGLDTGIVMPLTTFRALKCQQLFGTSFDKQIFDERVDYGEMSEILARKDFQATLLGLAKVRNGFYGSQSSAIDFEVDHKRHPETNTDVISHLGDDLPFIWDERGIRLTKEVKLKLSSELDYKVHGYDMEYASGGCPVRHGSYPVVGEHAAKAANSLGIDPAELSHPGGSAIVRACMFIGDCTAELDSYDSGRLAPVLVAARS